MSLTEEQKTAKNFQEFYTKIRPYLNGSFPTPIVNKFSKGDLYSTDEKIIGQWIDGKPIYQKTVEFTQTLPAGSATTVAHGITNLDIQTCFIVNGSLHTTGGNVVPFPTISSLVASLVGVQSITASVLNISVGTNYTDTWTINGGCFTLQYTKTTDSSISIGDGNDYSTDEQVVGTWIDGKPVYQKTFTGTLSSSSDTVTLSISNIGTYIHGYGFAEPDTSIPFANNSLYLQFQPTVSNECVLLKRASASHWAGNNFTVTILYTKTTD